LDLLYIDDMKHNQAPVSKKFETLVAASALAFLAFTGGVALSPDVRPQANLATASAKKPRTPFSVLTGIITSLDHGGEARVAANKIAIPGPINEATGRPIVFKVDNQPYFAYTQETRPNFDQKRPADVAGDMAIVREPADDQHIILGYAHLDKTSILVNERNMAVGYSTGGDSSR